MLAYLFEECSFVAIITEEPVKSPWMLGERGHAMKALVSNIILFLEQDAWMGESCITFCAKRARESMDLAPAEILQEDIETYIFLQGKCTVFKLRLYCEASIGNIVNIMLGRSYQKKLTNSCINGPLHTLFSLQLISIGLS